MAPPGRLEAPPCFLGPRELGHAPLADAVKTWPGLAISEDQPEDPAKSAKDVIEESSPKPLEPPTVKKEVEAEESRAKPKPLQPPKVKKEKEEEGEEEGEQEERGRGVTGERRRGGTGGGGRRDRR